MKPAPTAASVHCPHLELFGNRAAGAAVSLPVSDNHCIFFSYYLKDGSDYMFIPPST